MVDVVFPERVRVDEVDDLHQGLILDFRIVDVESDWQQKMEFNKFD